MQEAFRLLQQTWAISQGIYSLVVVASPGLEVLDFTFPLPHTAWYMKQHLPSRMP
ncbi:MAG: hypothetical protein ACHWZW_10700 [Spirulina sp.]